MPALKRPTSVIQNPGADLAPGTASPPAEPRATRPSQPGTREGPEPKGTPLPARPRPPAAQPRPLGPETTGPPLFCLGGPDAQGAGGASGARPASPAVSSAAAASRRQRKGGGGGPKRLLRPPLSNAARRVRRALRGSSALHPRPATANRLAEPPRWKGRWRKPGRAARSARGRRLPAPGRVLRKLPPLPSPPAGARRSAAAASWGGAASSSSPTLRPARLSTSPARPIARPAPTYFASAPPARLPVEARRAAERGKAAAGGLLSGFRGAGARRPVRPSVRWAGRLRSPRSPLGALGSPPSRQP